MGKIRVAIAGVGNCASSLVQGIFYYQDAKEDDFVPGVHKVKFGPYHISDIEFVAAFDVDARKVGKDLSEAIFAEPNCTPKFADVPKLGVEVKFGPILDGLGKHARQWVKIPEGVKPVDVADVLKEAKADVLINFLPVGSYEASRYYAKAALEAGVAFANGIPEFIVSDPERQKKFYERGLPMAGDDIQSQLGATVLHKTLIKLFVDRGLGIDESYQLNVGGNLDFRNMLDEERLKRKRISKTEAVAKMVPYDVPLRIGPSDFVGFLKDNKIAYIYIKGRNRGEQPVRLDVKLSVIDSPNSAGIMVDVVRALKIALDHGIAGPIISISAYSFKHPPVHAPYQVAKERVDRYIKDPVGTEKELREKFRGKGVYV